MERQNVDHPPGIHVDDVVIRPATEADAQAIGHLWEKLVSYHHNLDTDLPTATGDGAGIYGRRIANRIEDSHTRALVAEHDGQVIGFALGVIVDMMPEMFEQETGGFLADIFIEDRYRRLGVGRRLVHEIGQWFRSRGIQHMEWYVAARNRAGRDFWESIGGRDIMVRMRMEL